MAQQVLMEHLVWLVHLDLQGSLDKLENQGSLALQECLASLGDLVNLVRRDLLDHLVLKEDQAYQGHLVCLVSLESVDFLDFQECLA